MVRQANAFKHRSGLGDGRPAPRRDEDDAAALRIELALADEVRDRSARGRDCRPSPGRRDVIALRGDLGAGKTVFARAFIRARTRPDEEVPSPTFTLVQVYEPAGRADAAIWHFDLFRLATAEDALELGIEDAFGGAISLIEWPERLGRLLPASRLDADAVASGPPPTAAAC